MMLIMRSLCRQLLGFLCSRRTSVRAGRKFGQAKVAQLDVAAAVKEDVGWLEVAAAVATRQSQRLLHDPTPEPAQSSYRNRTYCMTWPRRGWGRACRWMMPCAWMWAKPPRICRTTRQASRSSRGPSSRACRSVRGQYSICM